MRWLMERYRRFFEVIGYPYPPQYQLVAMLGLLFLTATATAQRIVHGVSGGEWALVIGAVCLILLPVGYSISPRPRRLQPTLPICLIGSALLFWSLPVSGDTAVLLLACGAAMSGAVTPPRQSVVYAVVYCTAAAFGHLAVDTSWLGVFMVGFGAVVGQVLQLQLRINLSEREARQRQFALDRARIAGDVHDVVAHSLSIVLLNVTAARRALIAHDGDDRPTDADVAEAVEALADAEQHGRTAMNDVRRTIELLRDGGPPATAQPGLSDLRPLVDGFRRAGNPVSLDYRPPSHPVDDATGLAVFRIVQESLTNAARHAPGAPVSVEVGPRGRDGLAVSVCNPAPTMRRGSSGFGLKGMASRVETCGGALATRHIDGQWCVEAYFPGVEETVSPVADETATGCLLRGPANPVRGQGVAGA